LNHYASPEFWSRYHALPADIQEVADRAFELLKVDSRHPSIQLKRVGEYWSARVGLHYRAVGITIPDGILWIWIGPHARYDHIIG
jgi:hypothetical protein